MSVEEAPVPPEPQAQPKPKKRFKVEPQEGGQLEQYLVVNAAAKNAADVAGEEADLYKEAIKNWLLSLFPPLRDGSPNPDLPDAFDIAGDAHGRYPAYTMTLKGGYHLDKEAMTRDGHGELVERYKVPNKASWELRPSTQGRKYGK